MKTACIIPHYNHPKTVLSVAERAKQYLETVWIVDDGSSTEPENFEERAAALGVRLIRHERNQGKGAALRTAAAELEKAGFDYMIVIDADGQHNPDELPRFTALLEGNSDCVIVGCRDFDSVEVPGSSRFGRKFSNFWCRLETGIRCEDTQSGFRAYPVKPFSQLQLHCVRYNFEIEILVKLLWAGYKLLEVPISVTYEKRITHFHPWKDNFRLSLLHSYLVMRHLLPIPHGKLVRQEDKHYREILRHPLQFIQKLLKEDATPSGLALSAAVGTFLAVLPLIGVHMLVILYLCIKLRLNKVMALAIQNLFMPPLSPFLCIQLGYFLRNGHWWTEFSMKTCVYEMHHRVWEWLLGSLVLAPLWAVLIYGIVYALAALFQRKKEESAPNLSAKRGNWLGIGFFKVLLFCGGYRLSLFCAWIVTWFYAVFDRTAHKAALPYLMLRFPQDGTKKKHFHRLIYELAKGLIISYRSGLGRKIPIREEGREYLQADRGQILVLAHFGCWQSAMTLLGTPGHTANIMARPDKNGNLDKFLALGGDRQFRVISTEGFAGGILDAADALEREETVIIMGDRAVDGAPAISVPFLSGELELPLSPWQLAARCGKPVIPVLVFLQEKPLQLVLRYSKPIVLPSAGDRKPKTEDLKAGAIAYAKILEDAVQQQPYSFFRFGNEKN